MTERCDDYWRLKELLEAESSVLYLCHKNADADAVGAAFVLSQLFGGDVGLTEGLNRVAKVMCEHLGMSPIEHPSPHGYELVVVLDTSNIVQLNNFPLKRYCVIDHHVTHELEEDAELFINEPETSTSEIVLNMMRCWGMPLTRDMSIALLAGIITDTGHLRHAKDTTFLHIFQILSEGLVRYGKVLDIISTTPQDPSMRQAVLKAAQRMKLHKAGRFIVASSNVGSFTDAASAGLVSLGADVAFVATPLRNGVRISARAKRETVSSGLNLGELFSTMAQDLGGGGGGHPAAAGIEVGGDAKELLAQCVSRTVEVLQEAQRE
ncbi:MAG: DHH family phosphoesterase [Methermicoccaceae archaeon]